VRLRSGWRRGPLGGRRGHRGNFGGRAHRHLRGTGRCRRRGRRFPGGGPRGGGGGGGGGGGRGVPPRGPGGGGGGPGGRAGGGAGGWGAGPPLSRLPSFLPPPCGKMTASSSRLPVSSRAATLQPVRKPGSMASTRRPCSGGCNSKLRRLRAKMPTACASASSF